MSDAAESRVDTPFPSDPPPASAAPDALAGDWSEGLREPLHKLSLKKPRLLGAPEPVEETPAAPLPQATEPMPEVRTEQADLRALMALKEKLAADAPAVEAPEAWAVA
ncbi:MAG: hypothetical protein JST92_21865, partial [Deltaproteobacteria bacterium]|nr:hypothetical protein [Deltaproteobacteria bacterium]